MKGMPSSDADNRLMVFSGNANPPLAQSIANYLRLNLGKAVINEFSDGEIMVEIMENVRGRDVFVVQPTCAPTNNNLMELLVMVDALRRASAARITTVIPYFGYARQDRRPRSARVPITAKVVAKMIGEVEGRSCVLVDDLVDTAGTLCQAAKALKDNGAERVVAYCTHPVLSGAAIANISDSDLDELVVTDSIPLRPDAQACPRIRQLSIADMLAEAIRRISSEESVSSMFMD